MSWHVKVRDRLVNWRICIASGYFPEGRKAVVDLPVLKLNPVRVAFIGSLLLSLIASQKDTINIDGMLYVETARVFLHEGFESALRTFYWPFLSILMAWVSQLTGIGLDTSGYLLNAFFMAGTCALLVASAARFFPESSWYLCLVILSVPGLNGYRDELLREFGAWFFVVLALWLALRWGDAPRLMTALAAQVALVLAALFRPEALALFPALIFWQVFAAPSGERWGRVVQIGALPLLGFTLLVALHEAGSLGSGRLATDLGRLNPERFLAKAHAMAPAFVNAQAMDPAFARWVSDQAGIILFFGSLAIIPVMFVSKMGILMIPLLYSVIGERVRETFVRNQLFLWGFLGYFLVLCVFVLDMQFLSGRYPALLLLFSAPLTGHGFWLLTKRFPRWSATMVACSSLVMIANVVDLRPGKQHFVEAGAWLAKNVNESPRVYVESASSAYYAGWRFPGTFSSQHSPERRADMVSGLIHGEYDLAVLEVSQKEPPIEPWLKSANLKQIASFVDRNGDAVIVAAPIGKADRSSTPNTTGAGGQAQSN